MECPVALQPLSEDAGRVLREILPCSATDEAWRLLSSYLEHYPSQNSLYHRCVINKLLAHGIPLPNWLINSYKVRTASLCSVPPVLLWPKKQPEITSRRRRKLCYFSAPGMCQGLCAWSEAQKGFLGSLQKVDAAALLRLYLNYDLLEEAGDLVLEYVDAVLGKGHEYFGIEVS